MEGTKLTEKQKKIALNVQKKQKTPRNVLTSSLPEYWPCLKDEVINEFQEILKKLTKEDVTLGLQSTLRNLKSSKAHNLIFDDDISPKWFGKHLLAMTLSRNQQTKIFIVPHLKDLTKQIFGVPAVIFCINKEIKALSEFYSKLEIHDELLKSYRQVQSNVNKSISKRKPRKLKPEVITPIVHLKRSENPAFVPLQHEEMEVDTSDFICLKKYEDTSLLKKPSSFHAMKIKQVLPNTSRKQKIKNK